MPMSLVLFSQVHGVFCEETYLESGLNKLVLEECLGITENTRLKNFSLVSCGGSKNRWCATIANGHLNVTLSLLRDRSTIGVVC